MGWVQFFPAGSRPGPSSAQSMSSAIEWVYCVASQGKASRSAKLGILPAASQPASEAPRDHFGVELLQSPLPAEPL